MPHYKDLSNKVYFFESQAEMEKYYNGIGDLTEITDAERDAIINPPVTVEEIWEGIKTERSRRKYRAGVKVNVDGVDKWYHSDIDSRIQQLGLKDQGRDLLAAGGAMADNILILGQPVEWKTMDGSFVGMTVELAFDIVKAVGDLDARMHATAEMHKPDMEASNDPANYDYLRFWPEEFVG
jgi:hypothetical protein